MTPYDPPLTVRPLAHRQFREDVRRGLRRRPRRLPCKYLYDARGSALFEAICRQPEYYLTRAELDILARHATQIAAVLGPEVQLIEYGSGSGEKTRRLLAALRAPVAYTPIELSEAALWGSVGALRAAFPLLSCLPLAADFTRPHRIPAPPRPARRRVIYFSGSTLGNFEHAQAAELLRQMHRDLGEGGIALVAIDLQKDPARLETAYNDRAGVTAAFTLNLLSRCNRELGTDFDLGAFRHEARYDSAAARIETHLVSTREQSVRLDGERFAFAEGERMLVEYSHKYAPAAFAAWVADCGFRCLHEWRDAEGLFSLQALLAQNPGSSP